MSSAIVREIEREAEARGDPQIPRDYIVDALERVKAGKDKVRWSEGEYPSASTDLYAIAAKLYHKATQKSK